MGHKIHPIGFRLGPLYTWDSRWFGRKKQYGELLLEDVFIRKTLLQKLKNAGITKIEIERSINRLTVIIHVVRPGMVIGRGGQGLEEMKKHLQSKIIELRRKRGFFDKKETLRFEIKVEPVTQPNLSAYFIASQIAEQLEKRLPYKRVVGFALDKITSAGAKGAKIILSGRIQGAEISRRETFKKGAMPLSTIRQAIDFASIPALTKSGYIGVKVWICK